MDNPMGLDGFEFVEFSAPEPGLLEAAFAELGFAKVAEHRSKNVHLWRQGGINFIVNYEPQSVAYYHAEEPERSLEYARKALQLDPSFTRAGEWEARLLRERARTPESASA